MLVHIQRSARSAYRATAERHARAETLPPVVVTIASSPAFGTVSLRIRDLGGGIPPADVSRVFTCARSAPALVSDRCSREPRSDAYTSVDANRDNDNEAGPYAAQADSGSGASVLGDFVGMAQTGMGTIAGYGYGCERSPSDAVQL